MLLQGLRNGGRGQMRSHRPGESRIEKRVRYKRNALLGIYFGVPAILFSVLLAVFRMGIFAEHSEEVSLAIFVFLGGYGAVVYGCYWWLKGKHWSEAVLIIAFMPLTIFFIPFVRLLVLQALGLLAAAMVMAPLILVVVVAALPDKSGNSRQRAPWERRKYH
jgi:succinate-acetate transporter protein